MRKMKKRICLVLDCLCAHDFSDKTAELINLQHYVIKEKRLSEREAIVIFYDVVRVVEALHKVSSGSEDFLMGCMLNTLCKTFLSFLLHICNLCYCNALSFLGSKTMCPCSKHYLLSFLLACRKTLCTETSSWETWC